MVPRMRDVFRWFTAVLFVAIVAEIGFAGYGAFDAIHNGAKEAITKKAIQSGFDIHDALGSVIVLAMLMLLIVAATGHRAQRGSQSADHQRPYRSGQSESSARRGAAAIRSASRPRLTAGASLAR
jgi:hypothetical protein